jgi:anti-sigma regulatory factor (Ser/Thr protein kinase)/anti-anti-sigma regulatory factor
MNGEIYHDRNVIYFAGTVKIDLLPHCLRIISRIVDDARYPDIILDFKNVEAIYGSFLTALLSVVYDLKRDKISIDIVNPVSPKAFNYMNKTNFLLHMTNESKINKNYRADRFLPIIHYTNADEQGQAVEIIVKSLLFQVTNLPRENLRAAQWAISEVTDNVLNHAESSVGGFVYSQIHTGLGFLEVIVADGGIGIPKSLGHLDHGEALEKAISEGVTRNKITNQGNGLYGTYRIATLSKGIFSLNSLRGRLFVRPDGTVKVNRDAQRYPGTYVIFQIDLNDPRLISQALKIGGEIREPSFDIIEQHFESDGVPDTHIKLSDHVISTGSREAGKKLSILIRNVIAMAEDNRATIDFDNILVISSSFADECFGRLISDMGPVEFFSKISFKNADESIRAIIDRSVVQRMKIRP